MSFVTSFCCESISSVDDGTSASFSVTFWFSAFLLVFCSSVFFHQGAAHTHGFMAAGPAASPVVRLLNYFASGHVVLELHSLRVLIDATGNMIEVPD